MTVVMKCDHHQAGVNGIRKLCQLMERYDGHVGAVKWCGCVTPVSMLRVYLTATGEV